jgi:uncharacterized membrane protein (DUF4010 family)
MTPLPPLELAGRLGLALGLAIFLGLAFEEVYKASERDTPGGIRTFPMLAVSGALLFLVEPAHAIAFVAGLVALALWLFAYLRPAHPEGGLPSLMIPASSLLAYAIGPAALTQAPWVPVAATVSAVLLLGARERLHRLGHVVPREELLTAGRFLVLVGIILPLVPNEPVTTVTSLTPYHVWLAVVAICTLSYASYLLQRHMPSKEAVLVPAALGGAYSSTATTIVLARRLHESGPRADIAAGVVLATAIMYVRLGLVIALFNPPLALALAPPLLGLCALGTALAAYEWRRRGEQTPQERLSLAAVNPLQITTATIFAALFVLISIVSAWVRGAFGQGGVLGLAAIVGATDIDPFVLTIAQGSIAGMSLSGLLAAILIAASSNNLAKAGYALGFGGTHAARRPAAMLVILALAGYAAAAIYLV